MGIRVHKVIGYGLVDVETADNGKIVDSRFNSQGFLRSDWEDRDHWSKSGFLTFLQNHPTVDPKYGWPDNIGFPPRDLQEWRFDQGIIHQSEFGLANVVCIIPPTYFQEFYRYDDMIDYMEETTCHTQGNRYVIFRKGIFPYEGTYMDDRNGNSLKDGIVFVRDWNTIREYEASHPTPEDLTANSFSSLKESMNRYAIKMGFDHYEHAVQHIYPTIPDEVKLLCEYCNLFSDPSVIWKLRPLLYVYWS